MSDGGPYEPSNLIDLYLDGLLGEAERTAFEQRLEGDPDLRAAVELQKRVDNSLVRSFVVPAPEKVMGPIRAPRSASSARRTAWSIPNILRSRYVAVAASLLLVLGVWSAWRATQDRDQPDGYGPLNNRYSMEMVYRMETQKGFKPQWICENEREVATTYWLNLEQPLAVPIPAEKQGWGLSYFNTLSPRTVVLLAKVGDTPVMVFADRAENDTAVLPSPESRLRAHRKQIGDLVLYEISPLSKPQLLDDFYVPNMPEEWKANPVRPGEKQS